MLLVFCPHITPRTEYIFRFLLHTVCGYNYTLTADEERYKNHQGCTINYSNRELRQNDLQFLPSGFLSQASVQPVVASMVLQDNTPHLLLKGAGILPHVFDLFAASFYLLSRYEEYLDFEPDAFDRFEARSSVLHQHQLLERPVVNEWASLLRNSIQEKYPALQAEPRQSTSLVTIDVDQAFAFRHRGLGRNGIAFAKNLLLRRKDFLLWQAQTFFNQKDPYDTFDYLKQMQQQSGKPFVYFINMGAYSRFDKNLPHTNKRFRKLLQQISSYAGVGLHPSFFSNEQPHKYAREKSELEQAIKQPVTKSRQHFLKLRFPLTYHCLLEAGMKEDYSMGYASHPGFRAGTCTPFYWFNLSTNRETELKLYPIAYMEGSLGESLRMSPEQALDKIKNLHQTVSRHNGLFMGLWHNHTVNDLFFWNGWKPIFEQVIHY